MRGVVNFLGQTCRAGARSTAARFSRATSADAVPFDSAARSEAPGDPGPLEADDLNEGHAALFGAAPTGAGHAARKVLSLGRLLLLLSLVLTSAAAMKCVALLQRSRDFHPDWPGRSAGEKPTV